MAYGDGVGVFVLHPLVDVVGHELTHGVVTLQRIQITKTNPAPSTSTSRMSGTLVRQWRKKESAAKAGWLIGAELLKPAPTRRARDMAAPYRLRRRPGSGTDPQPKHMDDFYDGPDDYGGFT
jgi:Zn-dependent metalloprotease